MLIGQINIKDISYETKSCEIGYYLGEQYTRHGYMQEAISILEKYIFDLGINRIQICTDNKNVPSQKLAKKCGYQLEGILRQNTLGPDGREIRDTIFFSKLKSDI